MYEVNSLFYLIIGWLMVINCLGSMIGFSYNWILKLLVDDSEKLFYEHKMIIIMVTGIVMLVGLEILLRMIK